MRCPPRRVPLRPFAFRAFLRGCLLGTSILLGLWLLGAVVQARQVVSQKDG